MASNYPPGVTGRELEIAGPDKEADEERTCPACGVTDIVTVCTYGYQKWFSCEACDAENDLSSEIPPEPDIPDPEPDYRYDDDGSNLSAVADYYAGQEGQK